jgi:hypothetical protein
MVIDKVFIISMSSIEMSEAVCCMSRERLGVEEIANRVNHFNFTEVRKLSISDSDLDRRMSNYYFASCYTGFLWCI